MLQDAKKASSLFGMSVIDGEVFNFLIFEGHQKLIDPWKALHEGSGFCWKT